MENFDTLSEAINALSKQGYTEDFNLMGDCIACKDGSIKLSADQFEIDKTFRFEDNTDPGDQAVLYAISAKGQALKGLLVDAYGVYSEALINMLNE